MRHWILARDADGLARLTFDKAGTTTNTLSADVLAELDAALDDARPRPAEGPRHRVRQGERLHRRRRHRRVRRGRRPRPMRSRSSGAAGTRSSGSPRSSTRRSRSIRGFCLGGGLELALACRYRVVVDEPGTRLGLPEVMLGIVPGWGGMKRLPRLAGAPAALDLMLTGRTIDARRAKKLGIADECVPPRIMENTARGVLTALPPPRTLPFPLSLTLAGPVARLHRRAGAEAGREARAARALSRALRDPRPLGQARRQRARRPAVGSRVGPVAAQDADRREPDPRVPAAGAAEVARQGRRLPGGARARRRRRHDGRRHRRVVRAARADASRCRTRTRSASRRRWRRAAKLFAQRLKDPRRARDASDRLIPDVAGDGVARADVIIEAIFENLDAKRKPVRRARGEGEAGRHPRDQHVVDPARGRSRRRCATRRGWSASTSSIRCRR